MSPWLILFFPLFAALLIGFVTKRNTKVSAFLALIGILVPLVIVGRLIASLYASGGEMSPVESSVSWVAVPALLFEFGYLLNPLSLVMLLIVTLVTCAIFYYSVEYMEKDPGFSRYFAFLSLFAFSMIGIVMANNFLQLFIFWELVGASSYLLIGFWYEKNAAADAGKKAFLTNRLGDYGFLLGFIFLWAASASAGGVTLNFLKLESLFGTSQVIINKQLMTILVLLIFCGVIGKSAQFPLHVWLPDAMEGPTPVSALIHAATMVAAGVYLLARTFFLFSHAPFALEIISYIGGFTAFFAATQALVQIDIKRVLAYSTLSQLGFMVMAVGLGSSGAAMFHLSTHAFFKALLFLAAGSVIHMTHEQDLTKMGGLASKMPVTNICFVVGALSLAGIFPFSGFWSKDEILSLVFEKNKFLFCSALVTIFLTAAYITRASVLAFFGKRNVVSHAHDPSHWMLIPLVILAALSVTAGFFGFEKFLHNPLDHHAASNFFVIWLSSGIAFAGILLGIWIYQFNPKIADSLREKFAGLYDILIERYFIDRFYDWILEHVQKPFSEACERFEQRVVVEQMVNGTARLTAACGNLARKLQTGKIQTYTTVFFGGLIVILYWFLIRRVL